MTTNRSSNNPLTACVEDTTASSGDGDSGDIGSNGSGYICFGDRRPIYVGLAAEPNRIALAYYDGHLNVGNDMLHSVSGEEDDIRPLLRHLSDYAQQENCKLMACGVDTDRLLLTPTIISNGLDGDGSVENNNEWSFTRLPQRLWFDLDILPFRVGVCGLMLEECADSAARKCLHWFGIACCIPRLEFGPMNRVRVDAGCSIELASLSDYRDSLDTISSEIAAVAKDTISDGQTQTTTSSSSTSTSTSSQSSTTWNTLLRLANDCRQKRLRIAFFNATPQGGGVALMRHSLIRMACLLRLNIQWFVPKPNPAVFRITKDIHNLLQGVAGPEVEFTPQCQQHYEQWIQSNCERLLWLQDDGPFKQSDIIILDDPQVIGCVPHIRRVNAKCKLIFRSHIQIRTDLISDPESPQYRLWKYLSKHISQCDLFISHPLPGNVPADIPPAKVVFMPAFADPLDGLTKPLSWSDRNYYIVAGFNKYCRLQTGRYLHYPHRPYICQISRFDPSKGMADVLECYLMLRRQLNHTLPPDRLPQLVLSGHGSVDDPDGSIVFRQLITQLSHHRFDSVRNDICIARLPPEDRILNALMAGARVALQLSYQEGFEVKVTEALQKSVPVIAYRAGGIPLQIKHGFGGYLVNVGDREQVVRYLFELCTNDKRWTEMSSQAKKSVGQDYWTVAGTINWLRLFDGETNDSFTELRERS